jgi:hypothetical protein
MGLGGPCRHTRARQTASIQVWALVRQDPAISFMLWRLGMRTATHALLTTQLLAMHTSSSAAICPEQHVRWLTFLSHLPAAEVKAALADAPGTFPVMAAGMSDHLHRTWAAAVGSAVAGAHKCAALTGSRQAHEALLPAKQLLLPLPDDCKDLEEDMIQGGARFVHKVRCCTWCTCW